MKLLLQSAACACWLYGQWSAGAPCLLGASSAAGIPHVGLPLDTHVFGLPVLLVHDPIDGIGKPAHLLVLSAAGQLSVVSRRE